MSTKISTKKLSKLCDFLNSMKDDAWSIYCTEDRIIDNSCCTSSSYYKEAREANEKEYQDRLDKIEEIKSMFGIE